VAFFGFGKKSPPPPAKTPVKLSVPPKDEAAGAASAAKTGQPSAAQSQQAAQSLDFTKLSASQFAADWDLNIQLEDSSSAVHPLVEETAILFANGQDQMACEALKAGLQGQDLGHATEQAWKMLLDLYQVMGQREEFETCALEFVNKFEKSPPAWIDDVPKVKAATGSVPPLSLSGKLDASSVTQMELMQRTAAKAKRLSIDLGKIQDADNEGCRLLYDALRSLTKAKYEISVAKSKHLADLLEKKIESGKPENQEVWLLLLELCQWQGLQEKFENLALEFAMTFEVSPPSWETRGTGAAAPEEVVDESPEDEDQFPLEGQMSGGGTEVFRGLMDFASTRKNIVIDLTGLRRMDFLSAGTFLNVLSGLTSAGKTVQVRNVNSLVAALFGIVGVSQVATVEVRK